MVRFYLNCIGHSIVPLDAAINFCVAEEHEGE